MHDPLALQDTRVHSLVQYAMKVGLYIIIILIFDKKLMHIIMCVIFVSIG